MYNDVLNKASKQDLRLLLRCLALYKKFVINHNALHIEITTHRG